MSEHDSKRRRRRTRQPGRTSANRDQPDRRVAQLADLKDKGVIDEAEFQRLKAKALS